MFNSIEEGLEALKKGEIIIVVDDEDRENEGDLVLLSEKVTPGKINFMISNGKGLVCVAIDKKIKDKLNLTKMVKENNDPKKTAFTCSVDYIKSDTGISAYERSETIKKLIDPLSTKNDFTSPGHIFPLVGKENGVLNRPGHTEAAIDLANLCESFSSGVICEIIKKDGKMARVPDLKKIAKKHDLKMITIKDLINYRLKKEIQLKKVSEASLPTSYGDFKIIGFYDKRLDKEHIALIKGSLKEKMLLRIHSECLTGDIFSSKRCDCGNQLDLAMKKIAENKNGILIYLRQEGRGIGLLNKIKAYNLQDKGFDTVDANIELGFKPDLRQYYPAANILNILGVSNVDLMTNNPDKIKGLEEYNINVNRVSHEVEFCKKNKDYLITKKNRMNHLLSI